MRAGTVELWDAGWPGLALEWTAVEMCGGRVSGRVEAGNVVAIDEAPIGLGIHQFCLWPTSLHQNEISRIGGESMHSARFASIQRHEIRDRLRGIGEVVAAIDEDFVARRAMPNDETTPCVISQNVSGQRVAVHEVERFGRTAGRVDSGGQNSAVARESEGDDRDQKFDDPSASNWYGFGARGVAGFARTKQQTEMV